MTAVERLESALSRWPPTDGYPGWILPIQQDGVTRGLSCKDLAKLEDADRVVACASDKGYAPNLDSLVYPSNTPVALMSVGGKTIAFMMGHHACPMQCDNDVILTPTYEVYRGINMMVQPDGSVSTIDMRNGKQQNFESREALEKSDYFQNTVASLDPNNLDTDMGSELENLGEVRKRFAKLGSKGRSSTFTNLWEAGSPIPSEDETAPIVAKAFGQDCSTVSTWAMDQTLPGREKEPVELVVTTECRPDSPAVVDSSQPSVPVPGSMAAGFIKTQPSPLIDLGLSDPIASPIQGLIKVQDPPQIDLTSSPAQ